MWNKSVLSRFHRGMRSRLCPLIVLLSFSAGLEAIVLEDYDVRTGGDPVGGSYAFWTSSTRFFSNAAAAGSGSVYREHDADGDGDEEMDVLVPGGAQPVFRYFNDTVNGPSQDPFYRELGTTPVFAFDYENLSGHSVSVRLSIQTANNADIPLGGAEWTLSAGTSGSCSVNLEANPDLDRLLSSWTGGPLRFGLIQEGEGGLSSRILYDDFRLVEGVSNTAEPTPLPVPTGDWRETGELGWLYGIEEGLAWSLTLGWVWHGDYPWIHVRGAGWLYSLLRAGEDLLVFYSPGDAYLYHDINTPFWAYLYGTTEWLNLQTGERFHPGARFGKSVYTAQPEIIPGDWEWAWPILPAAEEIIGAPPPDRPVYGLYCWANEYVNYHGFIRDMGWRNYRISGPMNDAAMRLFVQDDVEIMYTLATRLHGTFAADPMGDWRNRANYDTDEEFVADYVLGVEKNISRYGPGGSFFEDNPDLPEKPIRHFEIYNEPNFWYIDLPRDRYKEIEDQQTREERIARREAREELYGKLLTASYDAVKAGWPDVQVVGFAAGGAASADTGFIEDVHEKNAEVAESYDILSTHPYVTPVPPEARSVRSWGSYSLPNNYRSIRNTMRNNGAGDRPVWYTELNWSISEEEGGRYSDNENAIPAMLQAAYYTRGYALAVRLGVERLFYMSIVDTDGVNSGFINQDRSWRPSAHAVKNMMTLMPHPRLTGVIRERTDEVFAYTFDPDVADANDREVVMAWTVSFDNDRLEVIWDEEVDGAFTPETDRIEVVDLLGEVRSFRRSQGPLSLQIGPHPLYIRQID